MKIYTLILALSLIATTAFSQRIAKGDDSLDKKVLAVDVAGPALLTLEMAKELQLTLPQLKEVEELNKQRYEQLQASELTADLRHDVALQKVHLQNDKALKQVLTSDQLKRFLELEGRQNAQQLSELDID